jgi:hypothetical protein
MVVYFTLNRGAALFTGEICEKWGVKRHLLSDRLESPRKSGLLAIHKVPGEQEQFYSAGPALIKLIEGMP